MSGNSIRGWRLSPVLAAALALAPAAAQNPKPVETVPNASPLAELPGSVLPRISEFTLGGFKVTRVEAAANARPASFSGTGWLELPPPMVSQGVSFQNLVITGTQAAGAIKAEFSGGRKADYQGWRWSLSGATVSDQGSHVAGTMSAGPLTAALDTVTLTPAGLTGILALGDVPLAEGPFTATLQGAELQFSPNPPILKGDLQVTLPAAYHNGDSGAPVAVSAAVSFPGSVLGGSGKVVDTLAKDLPVQSQGLIFRFDPLSFFYENAVPLLRGQARLSFPLQTFCLAASTGQAFFSQPAPASLTGAAPAQGVTLPGTAFHKVEPRLGGGPAFPPGGAGFTGSFSLPGATLLPAGLASFHVKVSNGTVAVKDGVVDTGATRLSGSLLWGQDWSAEVDFTNAPAALADGLYLAQGRLKGEVPVGAYGIQAAGVDVVCAFSTSQSPPGLPAGWRGVYLPACLVALPEPFYTFDPQWNRLTVFAPARNGMFEADGGFSGQVAVNLASLVNLYVVPVKLDPFEIAFVDGALLGAPHVTGTMELNQDPVLPDFNLPISFDLTQNGPQRILLQTHTAAGDTTLVTRLVGVDIVLSGATLNPTNLDLSGRFDFHLKGAALPSIPFDHMVMEATGGGLDGKKGPIVFGVAGALWSNLQGDPKISLWGFGFGLQEDGYGTLSDGRFFVGFGGDMDINPVLNPGYNRVLFTTDKNDNPDVQIENSWSVNQQLASLGSLQGSLGLKVDTAGDDVSDAYFVGQGSLQLNLGDSPLNFAAGFRFGQSYTKPQPFPYFYLMGEVTFPAAGIDVAPDVEIYGLAGGMTQNFLPDEIQNIQDITGTEDDSLGMAIMAGVDLGTSDEFTFHGNLDLYVAQDLTTMIQGQGYLLAGRQDSPPDRSVSATLEFLTHPNAFHAVISADLSFYGGMVQSLGTVELRFDPQNHFIHVGTQQAPLASVFLMGMARGTAFFDSDFTGNAAVLTAGGGLSLDTGNRSFGPVWGRAYLSINGDLVITIDQDLNPDLQGVLNAQGGASFGMQFSTFWQTYNVTIFSGNISADMAFQAPGSPTLSGQVNVSYDVLGGLFSGSVGVDMEF